MRIHFAVALTALALSCSSDPGTRDSGTPLDVATTADTGAPNDSGPATFDVTPIDVTHGGGCSETNGLVYVVSTQNELWRFDPAMRSFTRVGALDCPGARTPFAMAVDRGGRAFVAMDDGSLVSVDTTSAHCTATDYALDQQQRRIFDLSFSTDSATGGDETLFTATTCCYSGGGVTIMDHGGGGLARIAVPSLTLSLVGDYTGIVAGYPAALAGTGDGRLFGLFHDVAVTDADGGIRGAAYVAQIDKNTGATPDLVELDTTAVRIGGPFAFSFWGGDFWFYTSNGMTEPSTVTRFRYATDRGYEVAVASAPMTIIGAGVSTCAPAVPP